MKTTAILILGTSKSYPMKMITRVRLREKEETHDSYGNNIHFPRMKINNSIPKRASYKNEKTLDKSNMHFGCTKEVKKEKQLMQRPNILS